MNIKSNIPQLANQRGWNAPTLAKNADIDPATAWRLMKGETDMHTKTLARLCLALECKPNDVLEVSK